MTRQVLAVLTDIRELRIVRDNRLGTIFCEIVRRDGTAFAKKREVQLIEVDENAKLVKALIQMSVTDRMLHQPGPHEDDGA